jgi:hypothetical protein
MPVLQSLKNVWPPSQLRKKEMTLYINKDPEILHTKTMSDLAKLKGFLTSRGDNRQVYDIPHMNLTLCSVPSF